MAPRGFYMGLVAALTAMLWMGGASAQSGCTSAIVSLAPCLNYITGNDTTPSSSCCQQLAAVVQSEPQCLCTVLNGGASSLGIAINQTQALGLPAACNVQTPPISRCNGNGGPATPPTTPSQSTPSVPAVPSGVGSKNVPTVDTSDGSAAQIPFSLIISLQFAVVAAAAYLSTPPTPF